VQQHNTLHRTAAFSNATRTTPRTTHALHETHTNAMHKPQARNHTHNHTPLHNDHSRQHTGVTTARWAAWRLAALAAPPWPC
jgi:hypothetical protein